MILRYAINSPHELIVSGDALGARMTFLRPKEDPSRILQLINSRWVPCRPSAWIIATEFLAQAEVTNDN